MAIDLTKKTDDQIAAFIRNYEKAEKRADPFYTDLISERADRAQKKSLLSFEKSLELLKQAAVEQRCVSYGQLAEASGATWTKVRRQMSGAGGHLDRLLDLCHMNGLPMLPAICVSKNNLQTGHLDPTSLSGFADGARRLGMAVHDEHNFHRARQNECWEWGRAQKGAGNLVTR